MGRRRVAMELIADEASRRKTLKVRKECVLKKAHELKTLCGVHDTCVIIYDHPDQNSTLTTYPKDQHRVKQIIGKYLSADKRMMMMKKKNAGAETQETKIENKVQEDDERFIRSLSWQQLKSLDDTLAAREVSATTRMKMMINKQQQQLYHMLMNDDDIDEDDQYHDGTSPCMAALNDVMLDYSSLI